MKLKRVTQQPAAGYPTFNDYQENRHSYLRGLVVGAGALLAAGLGSGCGNSASGAGAGPAGGVRTAGVPPLPEQKLEAPVQVPGEPPAPAAPKPAPKLAPTVPASVMGRMKGVAPLPPTPAATCPVDVGGKMAPPKAPAPKAANPVQVRGEMPAAAAPTPKPPLPATTDTANEK